MTLFHEFAQNFLLDLLLDLRLQRFVFRGADFRLRTLGKGCPCGHADRNNTRQQP